MQLRTDTQEPDMQTAMKVVYQWNYRSDIEELRRLYVKATEQQWLADRELNWSAPIDMARFETTPISSSIPFEKCSYYRSLPTETRWEVTRRGVGFRLSNFLHGEQGALMVAAQLVNAVPHTDAKFYAATQTMDEARHVEVFARYLEKLGLTQPISRGLKTVLDETLETGNWMHKLVGMQIVVEGLALFSFRRMRNMTEEPLLRDLLMYVSKDEARHHGYGVQYIEQCVPHLSEPERHELEDFALEASRILIAGTNDRGLVAALLGAFADLGVDAAALIESVRAEREQITADMPRLQQLGPVSGFVLPTLKRCGLLSERVAGHYHGFLKDTINASAIGDDVADFLARVPDLPEDSAAWVMSEVD
jgi:rubrerythrin